MAQRKVKSGGLEKKEPSKEIDRRKSKIRAPVTHEDLGLDEEETWHKDKDKILLENDRVDEDTEDEEVFALKGISDCEDEGDLEEEEAEEDQDEELAAPPPRKSAKSKSNAKSTVQDAGLSSESEDEDESEEETWGTKKSAYYTVPGEDEETEDEEARALETAEAKRLQRKAREGLEEDDFGLGGVEDELEEVDAAMEEPAPVEKKQELPKDKEGLKRHLELHSPETLALAREWGDIVYRIGEIKKLIENQPADTEPDLLGIMHSHYQVLLTYATTLAFYLHLRATPSHATSPSPLSDHPVLDRLLELKQFLHVMESYNFAADDPLRTGELEDEDDEEGMDGVWDLKKRMGLEDGELEALLKETRGVEKELAEEEEPVMTNGKVKAKSKADGKPKSNGKEKKPVKEKKKGVSFDLVQPEFVPSARKRPSASVPADASADDLAYGEVTTLTAADLADKAARKRSLRFHTSRIESAAARRDAARRNREGGDEDIPYKARRKEVELQANARAEARLKKRQEQEGAELDDEEWGESDRKRAREAMQPGEEEDYEGLYEAVERGRKRRKLEKKEAYDEERAAERFIPDEEGPNGPRSLTRAILTNRGLAPKRSKLARNPRVKKRVKFEKAQKKLASQKAVFRGGQAALAGDYSGEKSGISKRLVKSVKL
ncbi:hypothetical protein DACRYDRAFT_110601 [Dacryopinax primogenitus]|uniref:Sas10 C-terminal domain-containing protein n=1 Tax=Dacryopinax primogenitus (strain DJM 731) TaxID=1858805 RepID=M5FSB5_DACPD|nr:uncharacterized protein DACRYDRAFT_110601 [Dacryopinax primogenitus]EJT98698.1 hypothetical protein DACRYDRAFT_110601 [Dacryopinax primogenitus]